MANEKSVMAVIRASRPTFRNDNDKIAFVVHASFLASGYVLIATGPQAFVDNALSSPSSDEVGIDLWNARNDEYAFVYTNPEKSSEKILVKCLVMNDILLVDALVDGDDTPVHLEIKVCDYVTDDGGANYSAYFKKLDKLVTDIDNEIFSKLGGGSKASASDTHTSLEASEGSRRNITNPYVGVAEPTGPQHHPSGLILPHVPPYGHSDLFPGPGAGMYPSRGGFGDGSMLLGPNDPHWFGGGVGGGFGGGVGGGFPGGRQGVPPGARFDPYGPPGVPGFEPNRFARNRRQPGRGHHPDLEHFGNDNDFI